MKPAIITIIIIIIIIFQTKSWHQVLKKAFLQAAKNAIQKLEKVVDSSSSSSSSSCCQGSFCPFFCGCSSSVDALLILIIRASSLFLIGLPTDGVVLSIHRSDLRR
jgi:hypothetical protein